tara:strand:- start:478 stop:798 length:321 start_codon:yes stop_codon:yes gene_type:complete
MAIINRIPGFLSGAATGTAGTAQTVPASGTTRIKVNSYSIIAKSANAGTIYVGGSGVATNGLDDGYAAGSALNVPPPSNLSFHNLSEVYWIPDTTGDGIDFVAVPV